MSALPLHPSSPLPANNTRAYPQPRRLDSLTPDARALLIALLTCVEAAYTDTTPTPPAEVRPLRLVPEPRGQT
jgi:hypothetical protein